MTIMVSSSDSTPNTTSSPATVPVVSVLPLAAATEVPWVVPTGAKKLSFKLRTVSTTKLATAAGNIALSTYYTIPEGNEYEEFGLFTTSGLTLYFQCDIINTLEIKTWT